jgi:hypothetical protein
VACKREDRFRRNTIAFWLSDEQKGSFIRLAEPYSHSGEERKTRLRVCIFDGEAVKSAFALLLIKVTKPSLRNLLSRAVSSTRYG